MEKKEQEVKQSFFQRLRARRREIEELSTQAYIERRRRNVVFGAAFYNAAYILFVTVLVGQAANPPAYQVYGAIIGVAGLAILILVLRGKWIKQLAVILTILMLGTFIANNWLNWDQGEYQFTYFAVLLGLITYGIDKGKQLYAISAAVVVLLAPIVAPYFPLLLSPTSREYQGLATTTQTVLVAGMVIAAGQLLIERERRQIKEKNVELFKETTKLNKESAKRKQLEAELRQSVEELESLNNRLANRGQ